MANNKTAAAKEVDHDEQESFVPAEIDSLLDNLEPAQKQQIVKFVSMSMSQFRSTSPEMEVSKKVTPEHISRMIALQNNAMENDFKDRKASRGYQFAYVIVACALFVFIIVFLKDKPDLMEKILYGVIGFLAGGASGYGYCKSKNHD